MSIDNRISLNLSPAKITAIQEKTAAFKAELLPILQNATNELMQSMPKIGDKTLAHHEKCVAYMAARPELVPGFVDMDERAIDISDIECLLPILREVEPICEALRETVTILFSDLYMGNLSFQQSVRQAARRGVPGADTIYNDLKERFPGRPPAQPETPPPGTQSDA